MCVDLARSDYSRYNGNEPISCLWCGVSMEPRKGKKYHNDECRQLAFKAKKRREIIDRGIAYINAELKSRGLEPYD